jgi:hypothetical protein
MNAMSEIPLSLKITREDAAKAEISVLVNQLKSQGWKVRRIAAAINVDEKTVRNWAEKISQPIYSDAIALIALHRIEYGPCETCGQVSA